MHGRSGHPPGAATLGAAVGLEIKDGVAPRAHVPHAARDAGLATGHRPRTGRLPRHPQARPCTHLVGCSEKDSEKGLRVGVHEEGARGGDGSRTRASTRGGMSGTPPAETTAAAPTPCAARSSLPLDGSTPLPHERNRVPTPAPRGLMALESSLPTERRRVPAALAESTGAGGGAVPGDSEGRPR